MPAPSDVPSCHGSNPGPQQQAENCCDDCIVQSSCAVASENSDTSETMIVLLYRPPNGMWYVHSHKLYPTKKHARVAAREFLAPGTPISFRKVNLKWLTALMEIV